MLINGGDYDGKMTVCILERCAVEIRPLFQVGFKLLLVGQDEVRVSDNIEKKTCRSMRIFSWLWYERKYLLRNRNDKSEI